ncbi:bacteriocin immunity protein [Capnocytophaga cynodegmi]|uniref:Uncharacterized protein n=1 Tax=Capnocytophaga cynodegmi TaxID=28189 RepID=A0A0B7HAI8_9FLAO|nr:bacteriocin immunity protein [Capnocytophaga cynodegmi]GIM51408.1 hypothetical protein CAPN004_04380 [Capnocytophaga cynodegmi]GJQ07251.1 hypothetical protein CAPN010_14090 [Capnocytophaga cynodegmi]CEN36330.1 conserved hypothetical protein [Capnocytophaga cynodegmi]CEN38733.1 conserved hypothetical protein [Capnocytophaga cynodegmi]
MALNKEEIISLIQKIRTENLSETEEDAILEELEKGVLDPDISDYIYWSELSAEEIADKVLNYKPINL